MARKEADLQDLAILHAGPERASDCDVDIVAVHGLNGHAFTTWTDHDGSMWLRDFLPQHVPHARIMTFGYDSLLDSNTSIVNLSDFAQDLLWQLDRKRQEHQERKRPLVFICHSLGGVIVKQALILAAASDSEYSAISKSISAIAFFGTPHRSFISASPSHIMSRIFNAAGFSPSVRPDLLEKLEADCSFLDHTSNSAQKFLSSLDNISVVSFYEQQPHTGIGNVIVQPFSAVLGIPNEIAIPLIADHQGLARPSCYHPKPFTYVCKLIEGLVEKSISRLRFAYYETLNRLFLVDYRAAQIRPREPHPGTCHWIFGNRTFRQWYDSQGSDMLLLTSPTAGSGKTVLTRYITEQVIGRHQVEVGEGSPPLVATFFCSYHDQASNSVDALLRALLHQLLQLHPRAQAAAHDIITKPGGFEYHHSKIREEKAWKALRQIVSMNGMEDVLIGVGGLEKLGLDEALLIVQGFYDIREHLNTHYPQSRAKFLFSSRPNAKYNEITKSIHLLSISENDACSDRYQHLEDMINEYKSNEPSFGTALLERGYDSLRLVKRLDDRAHGSFLWVSLAWASLIQGPTPSWNAEIVEQRLTELDSLNGSINYLYEKMLSQIDPCIKKDSWSFLSIVAILKEPLAEPQLCRLLAVHELKPQTILHPGQFSTVHWSTGSFLNHIIKSLTPLVERQADGTVLFVHASFKQYLLATWENDKPELLGRAHATIVMVCLSYLLHRDPLDTGSMDQMDLVRYAERFHLHHLAALPSDDPAWIEFMETSPSSYFEQFSGSPLFEMLLASFSHPKLMPINKVHKLLRLFVGHGYNLNNVRTSDQLSSILNYCCRRGSNSNGNTEMADYAHVVKDLLELGANPNLYPVSQESNLKVALRGLSGEPIQDILLNHPKFDLKRMDRHGQTALHMLVDMGSEERCLATLDKDVDVNIQDETDRTALHIAVTRSRHEVIRKLLAMPGIRTDLADNSGRTPLSLATWWGLKRTAHLFMQQPRIMRDIRDNHLLLMNAARHGDEGLAHVMLTLMDCKDVNNMIDDSGKRFLHHAAMNDWWEQLENCLKIGDNINPNDIDNSGKTALHYAARLGCTKSCRVLLQFEARTNIQDSNGMNAVQLAADAGFKDTLMELLNTGRFDANQRDHKGRNLVHWAATLDCLDVMLLVCREPDVELARRDHSGKMPIDYAWSCQCPRVGEFLSARMRCAPSKVPWIDPYGWEGVYMVAATKVAEITCTDELVQRAKDREELERQVEKLRYPEDQWTLVVSNYTAGENGVPVKRRRRRTKKRTTGTS